MGEDALTALVCDEHPDALQVVSNALEKAGFEVVGATDRAPDAVAVARMTQPRLVVIEQELPGTTGLEVLHELREASPGCEVLLVTRDETLRDRASESGVFGVVLRSRMSELPGALGRVRSFLEGADERPAGERRTGRDRRQRQDWNKVTYERRSGVDRRGPPPDDSEG